MKVYLIGFMGSGKTHWGNLLSAKLKLPFFDLDAAVSEMEQKSVSELFAEKGEEYFRYREKEVLESLTHTHADFILSCGGGTPCFFNNIEFMKKNGLVIWLNTTVAVLQERLLKERMSRPLIRNISERDLHQYIIRKLGERRMYYEQAGIIINEEGATLEQLMALIHEHE